MTQATLQQQELGTADIFVSQAKDMFIVLPGHKEPIGGLSGWSISLALKNVLARAASSRLGNS